MKRSAFRRLVNDLEESARIAGEQLREHKVRSLLTALGVIIGVWAVISIGIGINGINTGFRNSMSMLGDDHFYVQKFPWKDVGDDWRKYRNRPNLETSYAEELNEIIADTPNSGLMIAVPILSFQRGISYEDRSLNGIQMTASNADFSFVNTASIEQGRFFTPTEATSGQNVVILGAGVVKTLFPGEEDRAIGKRVKLARISFTVIGTLEEQGKFLGFASFDNQAILPLQTARKFFVGWRRWNGAEIRVVKKPETDREAARDEIIGAMRRVRGLEPGEENDFEVNASDAIEETIGPVKAGIAIAGFVITGLSLFVGAVGIMNITFVSVKERTKEIGTRRAIGARRSSILTQFLMEAVSICLLGGVIGLTLAYGSLFLVKHLLPTFPASLSFELMAVAFLLSVATGILSGFVPALMASKLEPANALRHE
ncbi:ABC transporter permease [Pelagicoccus sp. SDUM812003]|uniref:ABC transporter permease n=1 Tax=Pelagicoccus sp. SDUM812003 TaxID=3041267 RepID=UPI00280EE623|nr:ABC transporter permease [Pelagicoccus sp. SDUM812003]MDQ8204552.1 ABC transporter permease [Pelagicoccus sp. SDUM812003]